jgi:hypothetical protein
MKKLIPMTLLFLVIAVAVIGCSSKKEKSEAISLHVALASAYISDEMAESFASHLKAGLPEYNDGEKSISVMGISTGSSEADPMSVMAGTTRVGAMMASGEVELWICDAENALRYADGGENYVALNTLFTDEELDSFVGTLIRIPITDDEGNKSGELSEICGLDLSKNTTVAELTGIAEPQMFIMAGSANMDAAKAVFEYLARG